MRSLLGRSAARFYLRHPWQLILALAGIALGVAVFVGIQVANDSARRAFDFSSSALSAYATHRVLPLGRDMDETHYRDLVRSGRVSNAAPFLESSVTIGGPGSTGRPAMLLGVDPIKAGRFGSFLITSPDPSVAIRDLLIEPGTVLLPEPLAASLGVSRGAELVLEAGGVPQHVTVLGTTRAIGTGPDMSEPILTDIASAQEMTDRLGRLTRIDLALTDEEAAALTAAPPSETVVVPAGGEDSALAEMTRAFTTNLTALGLLALVVGMFLIHSTMAFAVVQRRKSLAVLRALGMTRGELLRGLLVEAGILGLVASAGGVALGHLLATGLVDLVLRTMGDLAFSRALLETGRSAAIYGYGLLVGVTVTVVAALLPALEAARQEPAQAERRSALERAASRRARRMARSALPTAALAGALLVLSGQSLPVAFAALFLVLAAGAMCVPLATAGLMRAIEPAVRRLGGLPGTMAVRAVSASLSRTGVATTALAVAVATVMSIGLMIGSFRSSLIDWIGTTLTADLYLSVDPDTTSADEWIGEIASLAGVRGYSLSARVRLPSEYGEIGVRAATPGPEGWGLDLIGEAEDGWSESLLATNRVIVSEPFAFRHSLEVGDEIRLPTPRGNQRFRISGIVRDYNTGGSGVVLGLETYRRLWNDARISGVGLHLADGVGSDGVAERVLNRVPREAQAQVRSTEAIERISLTIFDRTFEVTSVLRTLAGLVAFLGVLSAVLALQLEREREFAVLRSIGLSIRELRQHVVTQTGLLGLAAGLTAIPMGCALAWLLVYVINRRSFGWSMDFVVSAAPIAYGVAVAIGAALLAGLYAALVGASPDPGSALRDE